MHQMLLLSPFLPFVIQGDTFDFILHLEFRKFHEPVPHIGLENGSEGKAILLPIVIEDGCSFPAEQPNMVDSRRITSSKEKPPYLLEIRWFLWLRRQDSNLRPWVRGKTMLSGMDSLVYAPGRKMSYRSISILPMKR